MAARFTPISGRSVCIDPRNSAAPREDLKGSRQGNQSLTWPGHEAAYAGGGKGYKENEASASFGGRSYRQIIWATTALRGRGAVSSAFSRSKATAKDGDGLVSTVLSARGRAGTESTTHEQWSNSRSVISRVDVKQLGDSIGATRGTLTAGLAAGISHV